ncbi:MAG: glycoside hydrolase family 3 N-terminal domain-containing protein [Bacteroidales bacterium]
MKNKTISGLLVALLLGLYGCADEKLKSEYYDEKIEQRVEQILKKMTLEEKVGQMTQLALDVVGKGNSVYESDFPFEFDEALLDTVIRKYKVGSILNTATNTPFTHDEWSNIIKRLQDEAINETGIPILYGVDQIHGTTYTIGGTLFPQQIGMGATFNPLLVKRSAEVTAYETRAGSIPWNFSPVLDLGRDARWSRQWETYSEDSYLVSVMGKACTEGYQGSNPNDIGQNNVSSCLKHFMGYGVTSSGKDRTPSYISEQDLRERHFEPFKEAINAGALSVMANSGMNNGVPYHINYKYLTEWLKEDLNWDGLIVTDWADINNITLRDKIVPTKKEAIKLAINAGIDMSMVPYEWSFCVYLKELVQEGEVPMSRIDDAVRRVLRMKLRLGLFEKPYSNPNDYPLFGSTDHADIARKSADESITLLKNEDNILPLKQGKRVLVTGPNANSMRTLNGGWTMSWQGEKGDEYLTQYNTILEAVQNRIGVNNVVYEPGVTYKTQIPSTTSISYDQENSPEIDKAVAASRSVDYIILCLGENSYCETPGNLNTLDISINQANLARALVATGKPVILVLNEGRPRVISDIEPSMKAVVQTYLPGNYGGDALAAILWGDINPSGRLPYTYPRSANSLITYDYKPSEDLDKMQGAYDYDAVMSVQWAFGYGLSYTTFEYSNLSVNIEDFDYKDILKFTIDVTNTGDRDGMETVMLYSSDLYASLTPDVRRLRAFEKIFLKSGEKRTVTLSVPAYSLAFVTTDGSWVLEEGAFDVQVANQVVKVNCTSTLSR